MPIFKNSRRTLILVGCMLLTLSAAAFATDEYIDYIEDQEEQREYDRLLPHINITDEDDFITRADKVRTFVNDNSTHNISAEFYKHWGKPDVIVPKMLSYIQKRTDKKVHLECSSRTEMALNLYEALGYRARAVVIHEYAYDYPSHTFLEVQNPDTKKWHAQDPDFNVYWEIIKTGERASAKDLIRLPQDEYHPCIAGQCDWELENAQGMPIQITRPYFGLASIVDYKTGERPLLVNQARFKMDTPQEIEDGTVQTYCEYRAKNCRQDIVVFGENQS